MFRLLEKMSLYISPVYMENRPISRMMYRPPKKMFQIWNNNKFVVVLSLVILLIIMRKFIWMNVC